MQKQKENLFSEKFKLLNSQENSEDILWTSSESGESDQATKCERLLNVTNKAQKRKRKHRKKVPKNISNLDVTIIDASSDVKEHTTEIKPLKFLAKVDSNCIKTSPVFERGVAYFSPHKGTVLEDKSPILLSNVREQPKRRSLPDQSPILVSKYASPKSFPNVRKKLFKVGGDVRNISDKCETEKNRSRSSLLEKNNESNSSTAARNHHSSPINDNERSISPIIMNKNTSAFTMKNRSISPNVLKKSCSSVKKENNSNRSISPIFVTKKVDTKQLSKKNNDNLCSKIKQEYPTDFKYHKSNNNESLTNSLMEFKNIKNDFNNISKFIAESPSKSSDEENSISFLKTNNVRFKNTKKYFDSCFSSETPSQCSITESLTPNHSSKTSEEIEILNCVTQINAVLSGSQIIDEKEIPSSESSHSAETGLTSKTIKYKKNGLAYRLNSLLRKHNANISLWQHEKFLAENSNFVMPKGEHLVFRIQNVEFKYGAFLIQGVDTNDDTFLIYINNIYVQNGNIVTDMILKLYEPYKVLYTNEYKEYKLIIDVCKFEYVDFKP